MMEHNETILQLQSLVIFNKIKNDPVMQAFVRMLESLDCGREMQVRAYAEFAAALLERTDNFTDYLSRIVLRDENIYAKKRALNESISSDLQTCLKEELSILQQISQVTAEEIRAQIDYFGFLPSWQNVTANFQKLYETRMRNIGCNGYGQFAEHSVFRIQNTELLPISYPDPIRLSDLKGYETERAAVTENTVALLGGKPAANVLLYGDAGTGKSSTVKALLNEYAEKGLRLIEIKKTQFDIIPHLMELVRTQPLKFILFIDDLSFENEHNEFNALKAILEGSVSAKPQNLVIYATSNRRHLVKETFSDREGDDVHRNETIQELSSLSDRFGLSVGFFNPNKKNYLDIVRQLKEQYQLNISDVELELIAEQYAMKKGGRSPRAARQLIDSLRSK